MCLQTFVAHSNLLEAADADLDWDCGLWLPGDNCVKSMRCFRFFFHHLHDVEIKGNTGVSYRSYELQPSPDQWHLWTWTNQKDFWHVHLMLSVFIHRTTFFCGWIWNYRSHDYILLLLVRLYMHHPHFISCLGLLEPQRGLFVQSFETQI